MTSKIGRASWLADRTVGHQEPGPTSFYLIGKCDVGGTPIPLAPFPAGEGGTGRLIFVVRGDAAAPWGTDVEIADRVRD